MAPLALTKANSGAFTNAERVKLASVAADADVTSSVLLGISRTASSINKLYGVSSGNLLENVPNSLLTNTYYSKTEVNTLLTGYYDKVAVDAAIISASARTAVSTSASNTNAIVGTRYIINSSTAVRTVTLPASPVAGVIVEVFRTGANNVTIARNGQTIEDLAENFVLDVDKVGIVLNFVFGTWKVFPLTWSE